MHPHLNSADPRPVATRLGHDVHPASGRSKSRNPVLMKMLMNMMMVMMAVMMLMLMILMLAMAMRLMTTMIAG